MNRGRVRVFLLVNVVAIAAGILAGGWLFDIVTR